eukprot:6198689-Pleurochrysis_carterae.AAC.1
MTQILQILVPRTNHAGFRSQPLRAPTAPCRKRTTGFRSQPPNHSPEVWSSRCLGCWARRTARFWLLEVVITHAIGGRRFEG